MRGFGAATRTAASRGHWEKASSAMFVTPAPQRLVSEVVDYEVTQVWHTSCPAEFTPEDILAAHAKGDGAKGTK